MPNKTKAIEQVRDHHARLAAALDQLQATVNQHRMVFGDERAQELQDDIDRRRFDLELTLLVFNANHPKK